MISSKYLRVVVSDDGLKTKFFHLGLSYHKFYGLDKDDPT